MSTPLVSVITPTYNHERFIADCIRSVQAQTMPDWEMIVVNDGSTDHTADVVQGFVQQEPRLQLINQVNIGGQRLGESYNKALAVSRGRYIAVLEGDDWWQPDKLALQVQALAQHPEAVVAWGRAEQASHDLQRVLRVIPAADSPAETFYTNKPVGRLLNLLLFENFIPAMTLCIRREALMQIGGFLQSHQLPLVDLPTLLALSCQGEFYYDETILGKWRHYGSQTTKTSTVDNIRNAFALSMDFYKAIPAAVKPQLHVSEHRLRAYFRSAIHVAYARSGRYRLLRRDFRGARADYRKAIFSGPCGNWMWRLRSVTGYLFSLFGKDVEGLARLLGKPDYKS